MTDTVYQQDLWGNSIVAGDVVERITHILEERPETRNDYKALMARYWLAHDGLGEFLGDLPPMRAGFLAWFVGCATSPKTLQNRCMEIQRRRPDLDADSDTRQQRERQSRAGPVRYSNVRGTVLRILLGAPRFVDKQISPSPDRP